jgi:iron complex outermembrane recepter protein
VPVVRALGCFSHAIELAATYFSYARGFKAGGFNGSDTTGNAASVPFQPEYVNAYELGVKSKWLARRVLVNIDAFRSNYRDLQSPVTLLSPSGALESVVRNVASARTQGVEPEVEWFASDRMQLSANASYIDAYFLDYKNGPPTLAQQFQDIESRDLSGQSTGVSPPFSASLTATFTQPLPRSLNFIAEVSPYFSSWYDMMDDPLEHQASYIRLDGRLGIESPNKHWTLELIGRTDAYIPGLTSALLPSPAPSREPVSSPITIGGFHCPMSTTRDNTEAIQGQERAAWSTLP